MIIRRYRNGVLISEEVQNTPPSAPPQPKSQPQPTQTQVPTAPKKGCGCGKKK